LSPRPSNVHKGFYLIKKAKEDHPSERESHTLHYRVLKEIVSCIRELKKLEAQNGHYRRFFWFQFESHNFDAIHFAMQNMQLQTLGNNMQLQTLVPTAWLIPRSATPPYRRYRYLRIGTLDGPFRFL
ncbi:hypothetical protein L9F63_018830, partial [Diploptera punctata]